MGSPAARGLAASRSGFASHKIFAGEEQSLKVARYTSGENPPNNKALPPFPMVNMLLLKLCSDFQLHPMDGSPTSSAIPAGEAKTWKRGCPGVAATACGACAGAPVLA